MSGLAGDEEVAAPQGASAAQKKKLRRKKAKEGKKQLKNESKQLHEALHDAQQAEAKLRTDTSKGKAEPPASVLLQSQKGDVEHSVVYVAEPLTGLDDLSQEVQQAAIDQNPYAGVAGMEVDGTGQQAALEELQRIAQHFSGAEPDGGEEAEDIKPEPARGVPEAAKPADADEEDDLEKSNREIKRERNEHTSLMISQLKQDCPRPEVVEVWDIRARDPKLLVFLKSYRNTVPVPRHWSQKRKYLQGKRGIEKPPFELPSFIGATGISDMRNALEEKVAERLKNKGKQRMRPKMGKMDIDYSILHDAFFKYQDKPKMAHIGDMYYEGKEYEMKPSNAYPGMYSDELKAALGMTEGAPPPWLINMQRYGPPPSYSSLKIPGLNAPIPEGSEFGYHPGGWGKPPVDHAGNPLYGDVFGVQPQIEDDLDTEVKLLKWGELEEEDEESSEEEEQEEVEEAEPAMTQEQLEQGIASGMVTGLASSLTEGGIGTDQTLDMRKASGTSTSGPTPTLYTVLEQEKAPASDGLAAVDHTYKVPGSQRPANAATRKRLEALHGGQAGDVDLAIDPELLEKKGLDALYQQASGTKESYSDMVADNAAARKRKLEGQAAKGSKKSKDASFKF